MDGSASNAGRRRGADSDGGPASRSGGPPVFGPQLVRTGYRRRLPGIRERPGHGCGVRSMPGPRARSTRQPPESAHGLQRDCARIPVRGERSGCAASARRSAVRWTCLQVSVARWGKAPRSDRPPQHHLVIGPAPRSPTRPPGPNNETQNPNDNAAAIRCGSSPTSVSRQVRPWRSRSAPGHPCQNPPGRCCRTSASPNRSPSLRFMALRSATSRPCSGP